MKPKTRARMSASIHPAAVLQVAILCLLAREVNSWQMLEPVGLSQGNQQQQQELQAPGKLMFSMPNGAASQAGDLLRPNDANGPTQQQQQQQQAEQQAAPAPSSMAGKILDSLVSNTIAAAATTLKEAASSSSSNSSSSSTKPVGGSGDKPASASVNIVRYMLKPRKSSAEQTPARDVEQQIIQQHARVHQHLTPARKFSSAAAASPFSESDGRDSSALSSIFDNFKSGITSRSSIVKAISDNKLARTLSDVGKTLGSNKYVAGAAAASALAALGLAVSKMMTPYMFSGGFSGPESLMSSGSSAAETYASLNPSRLSYVGADSTWAQGVSSSPPADYLSSSASSYSPYLSSQQQQFSSFLDQLSPTGRPSSSASASYLDTAGSSSQASYYAPGVFMQSPVGEPGGKPQQFFITYTQKPNSFSAPSAESGPLRQQAPQISSDVNGHYAQYYQNAPPDQSSASFNRYYQVNPSSPNEPPPVDYSYSSGSNLNSQQGEPMSTGDPMMSSSSFERATYATPQQQPFNQLLKPTQTPASSRSTSGQTGRRYGAVSLKLKESDRIRPVKASKELQFARPTFVKAENYPHAGDKSAFSPGSFAGSDLTPDRFTQRPRTNSMLLSVSRDQGQATPQASNYNNDAAFQMIKPNLPVGRQTTAATSDKPEPEPEPERRRPSSSSSSWISIQQAASGQSTMDHQRASSLTNSPSSMQTADSSTGSSNVQQERVFRTPNVNLKGLDYDSPTAADTFEKAASSTGESGSWQQLSTGETSATTSNNDNVIKPIEATNTKSGKLAGQQQQQQQRQLQPQSSQLDSVSSSGGLNIMLAPRQQQLKLRNNNNGHNDQQALESDGVDSNGMAESNGDSSEQTAAQRRGQAAASTTPGKADNNEDSPGRLD